MRFIVAVVGKPRDSALAAAISDYETRAARYWPLEVHEVKEERGKIAAAEVVKRETEKLLATVPAGAAIVVCDAVGESMTSEQFAAWMQTSRESARDVAFFIGGAHGVSNNVKERAARRLAMGKWTLPHEMARLVLAEQLYRAGTIVRNEPYHKA
ncbi:MAG: 23S rRNA (pseudouridine(1915)-N(3))-methyltransferase RlmH [Gemmatimonadaceae bacterium]|nr:23S rRNA (pseudouridine(1915)-N(3))-methyltransferase RlmH [Gemmatimonadaceae bacterium]